MCARGQAVQSVPFSEPPVPDSPSPLLPQIQRTTMEHGGLLRQFLVDDKGPVAILIFGAPPASHLDDPFRAALSATTITAWLAALPPSQARAATSATYLPAAGVTTGRAFLGNIGSSSRAEYAVLGACVNLAARLMCLAAKSGGGVACDAATREFLLSDPSHDLVTGEETHAALKVRGLGGMTWRALHTASFPSSIIAGV